jgi:hypothetical protein
MLFDGEYSDIDPNDPDYDLTEAAEGFESSPTPRRAWHRWLFIAFAILLVLSMLWPMITPLFEFRPGMLPSTPTSQADLI